jgi:hypothetical protein
MRSTWRLVPILALAAIVVSALLLGPGASAQSSGPRTLTLKELEEGATFTHIRNTKSAPNRSNAQGDVLAFTNPLADSSGRVVGKLHVGCLTTTGARDFMKSVLTCTGVLALRDGTLTMVANTSPGRATTTGAITGGTGAYANARGVVVSKAADGGSLDTITLAG